jgi:Rrf2 family protein
MFQLNRRADYAVRLLLEVGLNPQGFLATAEAARRQQMPYEFIRKVAQTLVSSGLLVSERGMHGGLSLGRPAEEISLLDIVRAFGSPALNRCTTDPPRCDRRASCAAHPYWVEAQNQVEKILSGARLSALVERQAVLNRGRPEPELNVRPRSEEREGGEHDKATAT